MNPTDEAAPLRVLVVCTGNVCRSPAVERLLSTRLGAAFQGRPAVGSLMPAIEIGSAGTGALVGRSMTRAMAELVEEHGADPSGFASRQLEASMVRSAGLVLAMTRRHRSAIVELVPGAVGHTFTLRELARLAADVDPAALPGANATTADRLRALVPLAERRRGLPSSRPADDDVVDPFRGDTALYQRSFDQLLPAVESLTSLVRR
ncbi:low molecular weight phosphatase family protein [Cellulomonas sp. McL0617]|uniref:arsenate reductase/protein-tyrosine-phosphatase family protein n=1 Tax=Cellulomonas sp. McL0617 TaxID=3415675 RepID=UPI003CF02261